MQKETVDEALTKVQAKFHLTPFAHARIHEVARAKNQTASQLIEEVAMGLKLTPKSALA